MTGISRFTGFTSNTQVTTNINLPATVSFEVTKFLSEKLVLQPRIFWTGWSSIQSVVLNDVAGSPTSSKTTTLPTLNSNSWHLELRTRYEYTPKWAFQGGKVILA